MITLETFMKITNYCVTDGTDYCWSCFGPDAYVLDCWNGDHDGHSVSVIFDKKTQTVYSLEAADYRNERAYRWINPDYQSAYHNEAKSKDVKDFAWDNTLWTDIEVEKDIIDKATAIVNNLPYDTRVQITFDLSDQEIFELMKRAHQEDITLNQLVEKILQVAIDKANEQNQQLSAE